MERIGVLNDDISEKEALIAIKEIEIERKQKEIDTNLDILKKRLRTSYMQDSSSTIGLILGADSFADMLTRIEHVERVAKHDRNMLKGLSDQQTDLKSQKDSLENQKETLHNSMAAVEQDKQLSESKKSELGQQVEKAKDDLQDLVSMEKAYLADLEKNKQIQAEAKAELDKMYREIEWSKNAYLGGIMQWPLPGLEPGRGTITCEFGPRFGGTDYHTGMDISGGPGGQSMGRNIVAADAGKVVVANWSYSPGRGYGIYVVLDHGVNGDGKSVSTLYGHCSNLLVQVGQEVDRGQAIAQVGSTGWSTGPHLHFEVRIGGTAVNPRPYLLG